jgi:hypothetical protein
MNGPHFLRLACLVIAGSASLQAQDISDTTTPAAPVATDPVAKLMATPHLWPKTVTLTRATPFPAVVAGREVGTARVAAGTTVELVTITPDTVEVRFREGTVRLPHDATNLADLAAAPPPEPANDSAAPAQGPEMSAFEQARSEALQGNVTAAKRLAHFFEHGEGVKKDLRKAYIWLRVAQELDQKAIAETKRKLREIIIPRLDLANTSLPEAIEFLRKQAAELDTPGTAIAPRGLNVVTKVDAETAAQTITLTIANIPLGEAFDYIARLCGLRLKVERDTILITKPGTGPELLQTKEFRVTPGFIESMDQIPGSAKEFFETQGVTFPPGASAAFLPNSRRLVVRNTEPNLDLVQAFLELDGMSSGAITPVAPEIVEQMSPTDQRRAEAEVSQLVTRILSSARP